MLNVLSNNLFFKVNKKESKCSEKYEILLTTHMPFLLLKKSNVGFLGGKWEAHHFLFPEIQNMQIRRGSRLSELEFSPSSVPLLQMEKMQRSLPPGILVFASMLSRNVESPNSIGQGEKQTQREGVELCLE